MASWCSGTRGHGAAYLENIYEEEPSYEFVYRKRANGSETDQGSYCPAGASSWDGVPREEQGRRFPGAGRARERHLPAITLLRWSPTGEEPSCGFVYRKRVSASETNQGRVTALQAPPPEMGAHRRN